MKKNKRVVIIPTFCEAHLIKLQIPNLINTIKPDVIIYNEGMFPAGPESNTQVDDEFIKKFTLDGVRGFDFEETQRIINMAKLEYPDVEIILQKMDYPEKQHSINCFIQACTSFGDIEIEEGDILFPLEPDVFHHHDSADEIDEYIEQLEPNQGFRSIWVDFIETQYYCEKWNLLPFSDMDNFDPEAGRSRRVGIKFGDMKWYKNVLSNFMSQNYTMLNPTDLFTFHYPWFKFGKYKALRYAQLNRKAGYLEFWDGALDVIRKNETGQDVMIRNSTDLDNPKIYAGYVEIDHPEEMKQHENWLSEE